MAELLPGIDAAGTESVAEHIGRYQLQNSPANRRSVELISQR